MIEAGHNVLAFKSCSRALQMLCSANPFERFSGGSGTATTRSETSRITRQSRGWPERPSPGGTTRGRAEGHENDARETPEAKLAAAILVPPSRPLRTLEQARSLPTRSAERVQRRFRQDCPGDRNPDWREPSSIDKPRLARTSFAGDLEESFHPLSALFAESLQHRGGGRLLNAPQLTPSLARSGESQDRSA